MATAAAASGVRGVGFEHGGIGLHRMAARRNIAQ
jgi:hypothetical protein